jgi:hypothetical protein
VDGKSAGALFLGNGKFLPASMGIFLIPGKSMIRPAFRPKIEPYKKVFYFSNLCFPLMQVGPGSGQPDALGKNFGICFA